MEREKETESTKTLLMASMRFSRMPAAHHNPVATHTHTHTHAHTHTQHTQTADSQADACPVSAFLRNPIPVPLTQSYSSSPLHELIRLFQLNCQMTSLPSPTRNTANPGLPPTPRRNTHTYRTCDWLIVHL